MGRIKPECKFPWDGVFHVHEHHHHDEYKLKGLDLVEKAKWIDIIFHLYIPVGNFELPQEALPIKSNIG